MCLSTVYKVKDGVEEKICEYVSAVKIDGDKITLTDLMGSPVEIAGKIKSMDFVKNVILVE